MDVRQVSRYLVLGITILNIMLPAIAILVLLFVIDRGFDITDESFYIQNAWHPHQNLGALTEFGVYLNLFDSITGTDVVRLRLLGLAALLLVAAAFAFQFIKFCHDKLSETPTLFEKGVLASGAIFAAFSYYRYWLITPSYNLFALIGVSLGAIGGMVALRELRPKNNAVTPISTIVIIAAWIGIGGFVAFIGRPTTALALGFVIGIWLMMCFPMKQWLLIGSIATSLCIALLISHVWLFEESWAAFLSRIDIARKLGAELGAGHTIFSALSHVSEAIKSIPKRYFSEPMLTGFIVAAGIAALTLVGRRLRLLNIQSEQWGWGIAINCGFGTFIALWIYRTSPSYVAPLPGQLGLEATMFLATLLLLGMIYKMRPVKRPLSTTLPALFRRIASRTTIRLMLLLFFAALSTSFGSSGLLIDGSGTAFMLYGAAAAVASLELVPRRLQVLRLILLSLITSPMIYILISAQNHPYRQSSAIFEQATYVTFMNGLTTLRVSPAAAVWIRDLKEIASKAGWQPGTPLIDLTGGTPGAVVVLAGHAPTTPWLVGGYKGSQKYVRNALMLAPEAVLKKAWILTAPNGKRHVTSKVLAAVHLAFPERYLLAGKLRTVHRREEQFLWRPRPRPPSK